MQTTTYKLNITPGGVPLTIHISQYDVGLRQYIFQPYTSEGEFTYVSGATVTLEATKPDGYAVIHNCTYNQDGSITYTVQEQLAAKAGRVWSKVVIRNGNNVLGTGAVLWIVDYAGVKDNAIISDSDISGLEGYFDQMKTLVGTPIAVTTAAGMTDHEKLYLYEGSETGYTAGDWYYWDGSAWTSGGEYGSGAVEIDPTLSIAGEAADAKATGDGLDELKNEMVSLLPESNASGAIAHFIDGADDIPVKDLKIGIVPKQSGSGDPSPTNVRPISGWTGANMVRAGKNLLQNRLTDDSANGITWHKNEDGSISLSGTATANASVQLNSLSNPQFIGTGPLTLCSSSNASYNQQVEGVNFQSDIYLDGIYVSTIQNGLASRAYGNGKITVGLSRIYVASGTTIPSGFTFYPQIEIGSTATDYEPYTAQTYPISWEAEAGTIYGGTLDVISGVLTVDRVMFNAKDKTWKWGGNAYVYTPITDTVLTERTQVVCSHLGFMGGTGTLNGYCSWGGNPNNGNLCVRSSTIAPTLADWNTYIASHDVQFVYYLANLQTYQLTPTEVSTLLGINNIWADTGDIDVTYKADTQLYIDKKITATKSIIAGVEAEYKATKNYTTGQFLIVGDNLYKVTVNIANGATIAVGTNVVSTTVAEQLIALANS